MLRQTAPSINKIYQKDILKDPFPFIELFVHSSQSAEHWQASILFEVSIKSISANLHSTRVAMRSAFCRVPCI